MFLREIIKNKNILNLLVV